MRKLSKKTIQKKKWLALICPGDHSGGKGLIIEDPEFAFAEDNDKFGFIKNYKYRFPNYIKLGPWRIGYIHFILFERVKGEWVQQNDFDYEWVRLPVSFP